MLAEMSKKDAPVIYRVRLFRDRDDVAFPETRITWLRLNERRKANPRRRENK